MTLTIVVLDQEEQFLKNLLPDACQLEETIEEGGLRTLKLTYTFDDFLEDKELFHIGNKIWVQGDENLSDCLYVINTSVKEDIYKDNSIEVELEEVLVELNYAPLFSQTELTTANGFNVSTTNGKQEVTVDWNAINYWFGAYFNIGVVQDCISEYAQKISLTGTMTRMNLLRQVEEETGNVFVTRYEKDLWNNTIHRYLDFLNPINVSKDWEFNLEYEFVTEDPITHIYDENDNLTTDTYDDVEEEDDFVEFTAPGTVTNIDPSEIVFRFVDEYGELIDENLQWNAEDIGLSDDGQISVISIYKYHDVLGVDIGSISYAVATETYQTEPNGEGIISISRDTQHQIEFILPDDSWFEFYNTTTGKPIFHTKIINMIGAVHEEILDFGFNLENITYEIDESDTYKAISPILTASDGDNGLTRSQMNQLINDWVNLEVSKGEIIPMIVQKTNVSSSAGTLAGATTACGTYSKSSNYFVRPYNAQDNTSSTTATDKTFEFFKAIAYWKAPFSKAQGEMFVETSKDNDIQYLQIQTRPDVRGTRGVEAHSKIGTVETSDENIYSIFNDVCMKLKDKQHPLINIEVDVANLRGHEYNNYDLHDLVYVKIPDSQELLTARVTKTTKEAHNIAKNKIEISNYTVNTIKSLQSETVINASNMSYPYPTKPTLSIRLENVDFIGDPTDPNYDPRATQFPANKLITISIFDSSNNLKKVYTKKTDAYGYCYITLNLTPGDYEIDIQYGGDEEFLDCNSTIDVNCYGTLETVETPKRDSSTSSSSSSSSSSKTKTKTVKTYWTKCGVSPDKKQVVAIAQPSASKSDAKKYGVNYHTLYKTVFKNKCPHCGKAALRYDDGKKNGCITNHGHHGNKKEVSEGEITCHNCDADYDGVTGLEKNLGHSTRLTMIKKPVKCSKTEKSKLIKGKLVYGTKKIKVKEKKNRDSKTRTNVSAGINATVKKKAIKIVGNSTGVAAAKKIAKFMGEHIVYEKNKSKIKNFTRSPKGVLSAGMGNCCSQTRLMLQLMDAAGCRESLTLQYVRVCCNHTSYPGTGHVFAKITNRKTGKYVYVDPCCKNPWGHHITGWGSPPGTTYSYSANSTPW